VLALLFGMLAGCERKADPHGPRYGAQSVTPKGSVLRFAVHPLHHPAKLVQSYQPLMDYLNRQLAGPHFKLEASRSYGDFEAKYQARKLEFILPNPWQTLQARTHGYQVIAMAGHPRDLKGLWVVRKDGGIKQPGDLKGKAVSYPSATALAACIMSQDFLHRRGLDINQDIENRYVGSEESSIMNVYLGKTAGGATSSLPWREFQKEHPQEASRLEVAWETEPLINNAVMVRDDVPVDLRERVRALLVGLHETAEGRSILSDIDTSRFLPACDEDYEVVRDYMARFEREVRRVEPKSSE